MRIEELVLEGFKSYPVRTQITGWDSSFNAITGLNGSGKSNILDAICFVLGITNMTSMRAQNQQDLIYKRGQAGITKASVTIVFDNSDRENSPVGLENCKQITVTRQIALPNVSKYLLNGHKSQQHTIQTLFQSVQLNINNPNFLIMQGRITKVLNMRPQEILGMVEEAAGTRMFEERKDKAKKTMGKKEKRVQEITSLLEEEITPKLDTLRAEKRSFLEWQKSVSELERIERMLRAFEWTDGKARVEEKEEEVNRQQAATKRVQKDKTRFSREIEAAETEAQEVAAARDKELKKGGKFKKLEEDALELGKTVEKIRTQVELKQGSISDEENKVIGLLEELEETKRSMAEKKTQVDNLNTSHTAVKDKQSELQSALSNSEELLQTLLTGLTSNEKNKTGGGYMGQLADARSRVAQAVSEHEQSVMKRANTDKELKKLQDRWKEVEREAGDGRKQLQKMQTDVEKFRKAVGATGWTAEREQQVEDTLREARSHLRQCTENRDSIKQRMSHLSFDYSTPSPNFDRSQVKGLVATLISLDEKHYNKATALEITAGGRLYNVVVDNERVGKELLQHGKLKKRVTIIPLNKINSFKMSAQKINAAQRLTEGKSNLALSLVGYPPDVANAMAYVFGDTLVCDTAESAKLVTFSHEVGVKSVTLEGDVYDPSGTLSGGSAPNSNGVLQKVQQLIEAEQRVSEARGKLDTLDQEYEREREGREKWKKMAKDLDIKEHEMHLMEEQVGGSNASRLAADVEACKQSIVDLDAAIQAALDKKKAANEDCTKLERDMEEFKNNKEGKIEQLKADISKQKATLQKHSVTVKTEQKEVQTATLELEQLETDIGAAERNIEEANTGIAKLNKELGKLNDQLTSAVAAHAKAEKKLSEERATLTRFDNELKELEATIKAKKQAIAEADLQIQKMEHDIVNLKKEQSNAEHLVENLEKQFEWIAEEYENFGKPGSQYDFKSVDISRLRDKSRELEAKQKGMKKKINPKVINMIDSVEKKEASLKKMLATVLKDKEKIEQTIEELDRYKRDALEKTWTKVNGDFGGIFAELLPGNFAKLQPPEGQDLTQGLEVKVQLGTVWKQSLTELSGGQRSLIALSLIMSLLQFKPAPMYILDEIDAALDLSHTQHIGQLFRTRFKGSQFIVVSLKEGLFTNANVLFRTRFRDGTSVVERTAQRSTSSLYESESRSSR
ncbi:Structural maintenance of chromosomes protein 2 [Steccherinum ochraceum]|uniref:Structural maintenance of chromosomes protein n=1 Tax=Steccherinum ochraceum TaxID=92696 RepID=A0A4R0S371_9APHY|nr:Structural maintenance of chromosomes protein 2 [Steccherinum ochraceum]